VTDRSTAGWAVLTGGGSGIGRALAVELRRAGWRSVLIGRRETALRSSLAALGGPAFGRAVVCDVRDPSALAGLAHELAGGGIVPEMVVAAAGRASVAPLVEESADVFADLVATNLAGTFHLFRAFAPAMIARRRGTLVALVSTAGRRGFAGWSAYCASKFGVAGLVAAFREELTGTGVRLVALYPGATDTAIWDRLPGDWDRTRMMRPEEVAKVVVGAMLAAGGVALEEIHLGPPGGPL
jgi:NADP-dependent 3-hydroxy acid dehydrogenase YdfG